MNILFAASELSPYAKSGGLGDVIGALPSVLKARGHSVSAVIPLYRGLRERIPGIRATDLFLQIPMGKTVKEGRVWEAEAPGGVRLFLIEQEEYFNRANFYGENNADYEDNSARFFFFSKAVVEAARYLEPAPEILHVHDWQTGLVPAFVQARGLPFKTVFTIHNLAYQGSFWGLDFPLTNLPDDAFTAQGVEFYGYVNCMKAGIVMADQVTTVSPRYAQEIQTEIYGCWLDRVLQEQSHKLTGILNGVDYGQWDPKTDIHLPANYGPASLGGKAACRKAVLEAFRLRDDGAPIFGCVTRLAHQKGIHLIQEVIEGLLWQDIRFLLLGSGDPAAEHWFSSLALRHPGKVGVWIGFSEELSHRVTAGSDFFLMPSLYEPCGLTQMYSLRYGTLPIVHETGGLADSVRDYRPPAPKPEAKKGGKASKAKSKAKTKAEIAEAAQVAKGGPDGTGFRFMPCTGQPFWDACQRARSLYADKVELNRVRKLAMKEDFSWDESAKQYEVVYRRALAS